MNTGTIRQEGESKWGTCPISAFKDRCLPFPRSERGTCTMRPGLANASSTNVVSSYLLLPTAHHFPTKVVLLGRDKQRKSE
eukprot:2273302-Amphidinium_carterae.1